MKNVKMGKSSEEFRFGENVANLKVRHEQFRVQGNRMDIVQRKHRNTMMMLSIQIPVPTAEYEAVWCKP
ncbi:hypothetical protein A3N38_03290 [Enterobacter hormaechei subsp. steigerwaltii]|nr:hypothetical protein A3N38_03290 [Enterobacter hormaechei subsp. steigerwaltii]